MSWRSRGRSGGYKVPVFCRSLTCTLNGSKQKDGEELPVDSTFSSSIFEGGLSRDVVRSAESKIS